MGIIKKASALTLPIATYLSLAAPTFAQGGNPNVNPCSNSGPFSALCTDATVEGIPSIIGNVIWGLFVIAIIIALFYLIWGGIKWILSGGDKGKVEAARGTIIAAVVGLIITFLAFFIITIVLQLFGLSLSDLQLPTILGN